MGPKSGEILKHVEIEVFPEIDDYPSGIFQNTPKSAQIPENQKNGARFQDPKVGNLPPTLY